MVSLCPEYNDADSKFNPVTMPASSFHIINTRCQLTALETPTSCFKFLGMNLTAAELLGPTSVKKRNRFIDR
jgi:hypothetical protein